MANKLTYAELEGLWIQAGGKKSLAPLMASIAEAESGGNPNALNPSDNGGTQSSYGLWQISNGTHTAPAANWNNPLVNARLAVAKLNSQGLTAWGTYDSGAYKAYLNNKTTPTAISTLTKVENGVSTTAKSAASNCIVKFPGVFGAGSFCIFSKGSARAMIGGLCFAAGGIVAGLGLAVLVAEGFAHTKAGHTAAQAAGVMYPELRAARAVTSKPGQKLTPAEVKQANANRAKLEKQRKAEEKKKQPPKKKPKPRIRVQYAEKPE